MSPEAQAEWRYRYEERLGILTQGAEPTLEEIKLARDEADEAIRILEQQEKL